MLKGRLGGMKEYLEHEDLRFGSNRNRKQKSGRWDSGVLGSLDEGGEGQMAPKGDEGTEGKCLLDHWLNAGPQIGCFCPPCPHTLSTLF